MKKIIILLFIISNIACFTNEIPRDIKKNIRELAFEIEDEDGKQRIEFIKWQENAYLAIEDILGKSSITVEEKEIIKKRMTSMYGANYVAQSKELKEEMQYVAAVNRENKEKQEAFVKNVQSKEELKTIIQEAEVVVPKKYMEHFKSEAERLYPNNSYEQKRYIESSINTYKKFN